MKVERLAAVGIRTVEQLARVDITDRAFVEAVTRRRCFDVGATTLINWKTEAIAFWSASSRDLEAAIRPSTAVNPSFDGNQRAVGNRGASATCVFAAGGSCRGCASPTLG